MQFLRKVKRENMLTSIKQKKYFGASQGAGNKSNTLAKGHNAMNFSGLQAEDPNKSSYM